MTDLCKLRHTPRFQAEFDGRLTYFSIDKCTGRGIGAFLPGQFKIVDLLDAFLDVDVLQDRPGYLPPVFMVTGTTVVRARFGYKIFGDTV